MHAFIIIRGVYSDMIDIFIYFYMFILCLFMIKSISGRVHPMRMS